MIKNNSFMASIFRMSNIGRWSLMHNTYDENLSQHACECALVTHFLASIGNRIYNKNYRIDRVTVCALFHDVHEVLIGDVPTPVKHCCSEVLSIFRNLEKTAVNELLERLPKEVYDLYFECINQTTLNNEEVKLINVADKLCAYIKCVKEEKAGNKDYCQISLDTLNDIKAIESIEAVYFLENCIKAFWGDTAFDCQTGR